MLPGHQIKPQNSIAIRVRIVIDKFCPNAMVVDASDAYRLANVGFLLVIEGESDGEHFIAQDSMFIQGAEPETRP
jgi:hypothetical protein